LRTSSPLSTLGKIRAVHWRARSGQKGTILARLPTDYTRSTNSMSPRSDRAVTVMERSDEC
jgi:hypothetical protein